MALSPDTYRALATGDLLRRYRAHSPFRHALVALAEHPDPVAVQTFAETWGLDCLPGMVGTDAVNRWLDLASQDPTESGESFGFGLSLASDYPGIDTTLHVGDGYAWDPETEPWSDAEIAIPERHRALHGWHMYEYRTGARTRILKTLNPERIPELDRERDRLEGEYRAAGYVFPTTETAYSEHLSWLFERLALRRAVATIADDAGVTATYCRLRIDALKRRVGIVSLPKAQRVPYRAFRR